jgi:dienelactone hydrolase
VTGAAASALLAAGAAAPVIAHHRRASTETTWDPADHESITFAGPRGTLMASWAPGLKHELITFTEADHAFFNDSGMRFNPHAMAEAWRRALNWFDG